MKKCPFCAEEIQNEAIKCRYCGEFLDGSSRPPAPTPAPNEKLPWAYRTSTLVVAVCCVGPLAIPLVWLRPKTSLIWKIVWTVAILVLSWLMIKVTLQSIEVIKEYYGMLDELYAS